MFSLFNTIRSQRKKIVFSISLCFAFLSILGTLEAQERQNNSFLLENGLEIEILEKNKDPIAHIEIELGSGYSATEKNEAGFFDLSRRLFWQRSESAKEIEKTLGLFDLETNLFAQSTVFSASLPAHSLEQSLAYIKDCIENSLFAEKSLVAVLDEYLQEQKAILASPYGFIHASVMNHLYPENPWAQSADMGYYYFQEKKIESLALALKLFKERYYQVQNIKLRITSPYETSLVLALVKKSMQNWENSSSYLPKRKLSKLQKEQKSLVLVSEGFPEDFEQFIFIRTIDIGDSHLWEDKTEETIHREAAFLSFLLEENVDAIKTKFLEEKSLGLEDEQYLAFSFEKAADYSRLISQYMTKKNTTSLLDKIVAIQAQENTLSFSHKTIEKILPYFEFYEQAEKNQCQTDAFFLQDGFSPFSQIEPIHIILLHPKTYARHKKIIEKEKWLVKTEKDFQEDIKKILAQKTEILEESFSNLPPYEAIFDDMNDSLRLKLSNDIAVFMRIDSKAEYTEIDFNFQKNAESADGKTYLIDEIIFRSLEKKYRELNLEKMLKGEQGEVLFYSDRGKNKLRFTIKAKAEDIEKAFYDFISLFTFFSISPLEADIVNKEIQGEERIKTSLLKTQLDEAALREIFGKTKQPPLFSINTDSIGYEDIQKRLSKLYNAQAVSLSFMGREESLVSLFVLSEKTLSFLKNQGKISTEVYSFEIPDRKKRVSLSHLFTSKLDAKDAGPRPLRLIPTTEFFDPLHIYFKRPLDENQAYFDAFFYTLSAILNETNTEKSFSNLQYYIDTEIPELASLEFSEVKTAKKIESLFSKTLASFPEWIEDESALERIKNIWIKEKFTQYETKSIDEKIQMQKDLLKIIKAESSVFLEVFELLIKQAPKLWLISQDTK